MPFTSADDDDDDDDDAITLRTGCFRVVRSPAPPPILFLLLVVLIEETPFWVDDKALPATDDDDDIIIIIIIIIIINVPPNASECKSTNESIETLKGRVERKACTNKTFKSVLSSRSRYASKRLVFGGRRGGE